MILNKYPENTTMSIRQATISDIKELSAIRLSVKENVLNNPLLVTNEHYVQYLTQRGRGWVYEMHGKIAGFAIVDLQYSSIWALFVSPAHEGKGIGKQLHDTMLHWYFTQSDRTLWLTTSPHTRAEKFYLSAGWQNMGMQHGEIRFEMNADDWNRRH